jgi:hypothetical protein
MRTLVAKLMWTMAAMAVLGVTTSVAQAGHYNHIDDHARDIERDAERARRVIKHEFSGVPFEIRHCLNSNLYRMEEAADCIGDLARRPGNLDAIAEHVDEMSLQLAEVDDHINELRGWCRSCDVSGRLRSSCGTMSLVHERSLRELCGRVDRIRSELDCLVTELNQLFAACGRSRGHDHDHGRGVSRRPTIVVPPPVPRPPVVQPSVHRGIGTRGRSSAWDRRSAFDRRSVWDRRDDRHSHEHMGHGSRFGRSQTAVNVPLFRHNGRNVGFSLSLR